MPFASAEQLHFATTLNSEQPTDGVLFAHTLVYESSLSPLLATISCPGANCSESICLTMCAGHVEARKSRCSHSQSHDAIMRQDWVGSIRSLMYLWLHALVYDFS